MMVTTAAIEAAPLTQADALRVVVFYRRHAPAKFEAAARRWLVRLIEERATLREIADAADGLLALGEGDDSSIADLSAMVARR